MSGPLLVVRDDDPTPPFEQVRRQLAALIASGALAPDQRLPPVRQLAADLGLAAGTVARTYRELEAAGTVTTRRGGGTRVAASAASPVSTPGTGSATAGEASVADPGTAPRAVSLDVAGDASTRERLAAMAGDLVLSARAMGARDAEVTAAVREALRRAAPAPSRPARSRPAANAGPTWRARPVG